MPFEVTCGQCHGPLLVEQGGVVVACPTCGAHLEIPNESPPEAVDAPVEVVPTDAEASSAAVLPPAEDGVLQDTAAVEQPEQFISHSSPYLNQFASLPPSLTEPADSPDSAAEVVVTPEAPPTEPPVVEPVAAVPVQPPAEAIEAEPDADPLLPSPAPTDAETAAVPVNTAEPQTAFSGVSDASPSMSFGSDQATPTSDTPGATMPASGEVVSKQLFFYVATYASAMTLVVLYLVYSMLTHREHALESLPDIEPPMQQGKIGMKTAKPSDEVPRGHVLRLGETQRFGNVRVTPLKITRGPVTFEHLFGDRNMVRDPSRPVYKLWLRFENVSQDQEFIPLSTPLVYKRHATGLGQYKTNNFLASEKERGKKKGEIYYLFGLSENSEFALAGQKLDQPLPPGRTWETFLAAEDTLDTIEGDWTWRVFFRKGYNPQTHRGVTTVIDVRFDGTAITADSEAPKAS